MDLSKYNDSKKEIDIEKNLAIQLPGDSIRNNDDLSIKRKPFDFGSYSLAHRFINGLE